MFKNKKILAIIPAREGSKGLPEKNIKILAGKPLIAWTIEQAKKSKYIDRLIVSTDDKKIAKIALGFGAEVPWLRPKKLAHDKSKIIDVIFHSLNSLKKEKYIPNIIILLQPTSPLRIDKDIDSALEIFFRKKAESLISISEFRHSPFCSFKINRRKYLEPVFTWDYFKKRRQDLTKVYLPNGAIYISTPKTLLKHKGFYFNKITPYIMPTERSVDIDDGVDFYLAESIIKNKK